MGIFDFFKKKPAEPNYDPADIRLTDMRTGFVFEYELQSWVVKESFMYRWQDNSETIEFLIDNGRQQWYMSVDQGAPLTISLMQKCKMREVLEDLPEQVDQNGMPPQNIVFRGEKYFRDEESVGIYQSEHDRDWADVVSWDYFTAAEDKILTIEQWGEHEFEVWCGNVVREAEFSNLMPGNK